MRVLRAAWSIWCLRIKSFVSQPCVFASVLLVPQQNLLVFHYSKPEGDKVALELALEQLIVLACVFCDVSATRAGSSHMCCHFLRMYDFFLFLLMRTRSWWNREKQNAKCELQNQHCSFFPCWKQAVNLSFFSAFSLVQNVWSAQNVLFLFHSLCWRCVCPHVCFFILFRTHLYVPRSTYCCKSSAMRLPNGTRFMLYERTMEDAFLFVYIGYLGKHFVPMFPDILLPCFVFFLSFLEGCFECG